MKENETTKNTLYQLEEKMNREHLGDIQLFEEEDNRYSIAVGKAILLIKELEQYKAIGTVEEMKALRNASELWEHNNNLAYKQGRIDAIDEFAELLKERLKGMQMVELQGEDVCPCKETGEDCPYMNQDVGCQYCAREQTIKDIDEIAEQMKKEG